ncbi:MAG: arsenosugar biosynthesis radical SAM protein ArsS [Deltaproteobacteria bacterium]|nr:arsenosugar biosynthesis radical SAM protein ArsS [Deltaproteobacteria bacterium]
MSPEAIIQDSNSNSEERSSDIEPFKLTLYRHGLRLEREKTSTLQVNVGLLCNQRCKHCHLSAGPTRRENMDQETAEQVISYAERCSFGVVDITGGAPELNPYLPYLVEKLSSLTAKVMVRSNLTALNDGARDHLIELFREHGVVVVASFPSFNEAQLDSQRGEGVFNDSITALKRLNTLGYGRDGSELELDLISNPTGAFLPPSQSQTEKRFRQVLRERLGVEFTNLFSFANVPLGRFRTWLKQTGNLDSYMQRLTSKFNPCAMEGVMCRSLVSVSWDGYLYDCDFNLARGLGMGGKRIHISDMAGPPEPGTTIAVADHCYTCTAGAGFT